MLPISNSQDFVSRFARGSERAIHIAIFAILVLFGVFVLALYEVGFFQFSGTDPSSKVVAAALALVGGFVTSAVSIIGILLKHSIDRQAENRLELEARRVAALQWEAEQRLKQEAAIRAVQLFSTGTGAAAPNIQRNGALFALTSLGQYDLTLSLVAELLNNETIDPTTAVNLIERALQSGQDVVQNRAADLLLAYAKSMSTPRVVLPESIVSLDSNLPVHVQESVPIALAKMIVARPLRKWDKSEATRIIVALAGNWIRLDEGYTKSDVGAILSKILQAFPDQDLVSHPTMTISLDAIRRDTADSKAHSFAAQQICEELRVWAGI